MFLSNGWALILVKEGLMLTELSQYGGRLQILGEDEPLTPWRASPCDVDPDATCCWEGREVAWMMALIPKLGEISANTTACAQFS